MMTSVRCPLMLTACPKTYNCCSLIGFDNTYRKCNFSTGSILRKKRHYDILGLSPKATQADVKTSYYKLSKLYHPDKNKGSADAAEKFRDINAAYEILGNFKLRRLYDKGIIHTAGSQYKDVEEVKAEEPDDPQTTFYKRHMKRTETPNVSGRTPIYNFDEWNNEHYGKAFERSQAARKKYQERSGKERQESNSIKHEVSIFVCMALLTVSLYLVVMFDYSSTDKISQPSKVK